MMYLSIIEYSSINSVYLLGTYLRTSKSMASYSFIHALTPSSQAQNDSPIHHPIQEPPNRRIPPLHWWNRSLTPAEYRILLHSKQIKAPTPTPFIFRALKGEKLFLQHRTSTASSLLTFQILTPQILP